MQLTPEIGLVVPKLSEEFPEEIRNILHTMIQGIEVLSELINEFLDFSPKVSELFPYFLPNIHYNKLRDIFLK